ncbi:MAG: oligogalacturonate lyase family protein [Candidatus Brocadiaceae bacterium]|jgi:oligogalacturonide lyase
MDAGRKWPAECQDYGDPLSGAHVRQLTDYMGHSYHLYFTNPGWWDEGRRLLFGSDRENRSNLFSLELQTSEITQLTDFDRRGRFQATCLNPTRDEAYFWHGPELMALDLRSLELRELWTRPEGFRPSMINCTADGEYVCAGIYEDMSDRFPMDLSRGYVGFYDNWEAHPLSRIYRVATDGRGAESIWEEETWIGHVNTSPTRAELLTFCHEGPWHLVDNRIWGMDMSRGEVWKLRPREKEESVGHEYWFADGVRIGYHGRWDEERKFFGHVNYDGTGRVEVAFPHETGHIHSNDEALVVGDASPVVRIWRWNGEGYDGPRILCEHRSSFHIQKVHVHPRFTPDGSQVLFTSDRRGYGNVYLVDVPEFDELPGMDVLD